MLRPLREMVATLATQAGIEIPSEGTEAHLSTLKRRKAEGMAAVKAIEAIKTLYDSPGGQQILGLLCMIAHPFAPRLRDNPQDTAAADGRAEVVSLLLEIGASGAVALPILTTTTQCPE